MGAKGGNMLTQYICPKRDHGLGKMTSCLRNIPAFLTLIKIFIKNTVLYLGWGGWCGSALLYTGIYRRADGMGRLSRLGRKVSTLVNQWMDF